MTQQLPEDLLLEELAQLQGSDLNDAIARELGYLKHYPNTTWHLRQADGTVRPIPPEQLAFNLDILLALSLPLTKTDEREAWIHVECGPRARWIVRLIQSTKDQAGGWKHSTLFSCDSDEETVSLPTAYSRAWLLSRWLSPARLSQRKHSQAA